MKHLTIKQKLIGGFALIGVLLLITFSVGFYGVQTMDKRVTSIADTTANRIRLASNMDAQLIRLSKEEQELLKTNTLQEARSIMQSADERKSQMGQLIGEFKDLAGTQEKASIEDFEREWNAYWNHFLEIKELALKNPLKKAKDLYDNDFTASYSKAANTLVKLTNEEKNSSSKTQLYSYEELRILLDKVHQLGLVLTQTKDQDKFQQAIAEMGTLESEYNDLTTTLAGSLSGRNKAMFDRFTLQYNDLMDQTKAIQDQVNSYLENPIDALSSGQGRDMYQSAQDKLDAIVAANETQLASDKTMSDQEYDDVVWIMAIVIIVAAIASSLVSIWIISGLTRSLNEANEVVGQVAAGNFSSDITVEKHDEIGKLLAELQRMVRKLRNSADVAKAVAKGDLTIDFKNGEWGGELDEALENMVENLKSIVEVILDGANNVAMASQQISSASQQMSQGAQEQASSAEEVSSSMEQTVANIQQNSDNARETEKISNKAARDIQISTESVNETLAAINTIVEKISVIEEIASRTDLLALNAAVEAARAGEHGKGFAVVADEVRKLAERSQKAASEISEISSTTVRSAQKSQELLNDTLPDINRTAELVREISASSAEQNSGADQVNTAIQQLSSVIQENASSAEEVSSNAEELSSQSEELKAAVEYFTLDTAVLKKMDQRSNGNGKFKGLHTGPLAHSSTASTATTSAKSNGNSADEYNGVEIKLEEGASDEDYQEF